MENLSWLFFAYVIGMGLIFAYLFYISRREQSLRRRISELQSLLEEKWRKK